MAITTLAGVIAGSQPPQFFSKPPLGAGLAGKPYTFWGAAGFPGAGNYDTTLNGVVLSSSSAQVAGQIPHFDPGSGNAYLSRLECVATGGGLLMLCDRLWHNGGLNVTLTTAQNIVTPTWPARDNDGATAGKGIYLGLEVSAVAGAGTPTVSIGYTNSVGTAGRAGAQTDTLVTGALASSFYRIGVQAGDLGVQSVQSLTFAGTPWASGTANLVAYRVLAALELSTNGVANAIDALTGGLPQLYNGTVPFLVLVLASAFSASINGSYTETQG